MPRKRNLNGIPGNLAQSYLSTLGYYDGGYMADWINYIAREKKLSEIEIDILSNQVKPQIADIEPLKTSLEKIRKILFIELVNNGFEVNFIKRAIMKFEIPINEIRMNKTIFCYPYLEDIDGKIYKPKKQIIETAYEVKFNPVKKIENRINEFKGVILTKLKKLTGK